MNQHRNFDWSTVGLDFGNWDEDKIWNLDLPVTIMNIAELEWLFDIPFWTNDRGERWALTPRDVIEAVEGSTREAERMQKADTAYPIDIFESKGRWLVLDGLHRLAKEYKLGKREVNVRTVPAERLEEIKSEYPMELPLRDE